MLSSGTKPSRSQNIEQMTKNYRPSLYTRYYGTVRDELMKTHNIKNYHAVPSIDKIYVSSAISYKKHGLDLLEKIYNCLYLITGQRPVYTKAKRSISQFKVYKKSFLGAKVCLTNKTYIYEFLERLTHIYLPSIKNFDGIQTSNLSRNTLNIGIIDAHIMPEINKFMGMETFGITITIVVKAHCYNKEIMLDLLNLLDIPVYDK